MDSCTYSILYHVHDRLDVKTKSGWYPIKTRHPSLTSKDWLSDETRISVFMVAHATPSSSLAVLSSTPFVILSFQTLPPTTNRHERICCMCACIRFGCIQQSQLRMGHLSVTNPSLVILPMVAFSALTLCFERGARCGFDASFPESPWDYMGCREARSHEVAWRLVYDKT